MATGRRYSETDPSQRRPSRGDYVREIQRLGLELNQAERRTKVYGFLAAVLFIYAFVLPHWTRPVVPPTRMNDPQRGASHQSNSNEIPWIPALYDSAHSPLDAPLNGLSAAQLGWIFSEPNEVLNYQSEHYHYLANKARDKSGDSDFVVLRKAELKQYVEEYLKKPYALDGELCNVVNGTLHETICGIARQRFDNALMETVRKEKGWFW